MARYNKFIPENIAPLNSEYIYLYDGNGKVGKIKVGGLKKPITGEKLYSSGIVADVHVPYDTAEKDFPNALTYFNKKRVSEIFAVGDLTANGTDEEFQIYANYVDTYSPNTPVYECTGNHDAHNKILSFDFMRQYTGHDLYYSFTKGNDVFIMFGMTQANLNENVTTPFSQESLQWLYETLETNRNKRCFVFQHVLRFDGSGKPYSPNMTGNLLNNTQGAVFCSLMEHYTNVIWFHGHSHMKFDCQEDCSYANYDRMHGCHSIHVPSLTVTREYANDAYVHKYAESEGYLMDVYENGIHLRGIDFVKEKFLPIASYWIDTTLVEVEANTFTDSTGTIATT